MNQPRRAVSLSSFAGISATFAFLIFLLSGCHTIRPSGQAASSMEANVTAASREPMVARGVSVPPLDLLASFLALPTKLILWDWHYANHNISPETEELLRDYIKRNQLYDVKFRLNQWAPHDEMLRLFKNGGVGLPYRIIAVPFTLLYSSTGRLLGGILLSDYYDPFSHTVHIFSDDSAIVLHEAGHAKDFQFHSWRGTYALARMLPGFNLFQESVATDEALDYLKITDHRKEAVRAYKILYPAYATYVGSYLPAYPIGYLGAILGGHIYGRMEARNLEREFEAKDYGKEFRRTTSS